MESKQERIVMLLDDNEIDNYINKNFIESRGISNHVLIMGTVDKALKYLIEQSTNPQEIPDIILLDINLPAVDGYGFLQRFKTLPGSVKEKCKIVVLSSSDKEEDVMQMKMDSLVIKYFTKPLSDKAMKEIGELLK